LFRQSGESDLPTSSLVELAASAPLDAAPIVLVSIGSRFAAVVRLTPSSSP
jgi:hypothetical protein